MNLFQQQFNEVQELLQLNDFQQVIKRIIDFTLDTEAIQFYKQTTAFLNWFDHNSNSVEVKEKLNQLLQDLYKVLIVKTIQPHQTIISIENLQKNYNSNFNLGPIQLEIKSGEIIGLVGENGNGKTTLLRSICRELEPSSGKINYQFSYDDGYDLRTKLVYIPQRTETWRGSMYENLEFAASCYGYSAEENNLIVDLVITRLGLRKYRNYNWSGLSSGYKMRFELARMLLRKPKILLIDEPLANLDILAQQTILDDFRNIANSPFRPIAIVLSSQQLYEVEKTSNQVVFLKQGKQRNLKSEDAIEQHFIVEFESDEPLLSIKQKLEGLGIENIEQNGGTLIATFPLTVDINQFMKALIDQQITIKYLRDITHSTRRFFIK
ncbi:Probable ABC-type transport system, ATPase component [Flavobacterium indicum GPTSA100-9 = DSM 17447]|uniref:Probable ABC-type transport system, ATPase component n=1 Tax=Flavobacterium indicum (strain DSM 17447 / CIP 109464 / GPTSA100-9) TaxID=1094466 RepID=H8XVE1_FLAIG|nr:ABC transporter ATP-binding protein [Flavobacterium indicum]CCG53111.1 Probable ABC-type transport system, ATPase component [Flavobacterium indicum GPTSA100-9 = DSM 17447]